MEQPPVIASACGAPPPSRATVYSRTLQRACEILGGPQPLAQQLRVKPGDLVRWIDGQTLPPMDVFLAAVDLVLLHAERSAGRG